MSQFYLLQDDFEQVEQVKSQILASLKQFGGYRELDRMHLTSNPYVLENAITELVTSGQLVVLWAGNRSTLRKYVSLPGAYTGNAHAYLANEPEDSITLFNVGSQLAEQRRQDAIRQERNREDAAALFLRDTIKQQAEDESVFAEVSQAWKLHESEARRIAHHKAEICNKYHPDRFKSEYRHALGNKLQFFEVHFARKAHRPLPDYLAERILVPAEVIG
jgi:hypothetical protein